MIHLDVADDICALVASENETNDDGVVVKCHHNVEVKSNEYKVVVNSHHDYETKIDDCYFMIKRLHDNKTESDDDSVVVKGYHNDYANESGTAVSSRHELLRSSALASCVHTFQSRAVRIRRVNTQRHAVANLRELDLAFSHKSNKISCTWT
uniref:Uncharacterized protein n=1 Tax=Peronospora matthiolae TaxID=2874970 RepID=A0AAV1UPH5_9STRA